MMKYMTKNQAAHGQYLTKEGLRTFKGAQRVLAEAKAAPTPSGRIFLSHSSKDAKYLDGPISVLGRHDADIYLDKNDSELPQTTSTDTARRLSSVIAGADALVLVATESSLSSKWVPWELGLADGCLGYERAAVIPLTSSPRWEAWVGSEYVGMYPRIGYSDSGKEWRVYDPTDKKAWELRKWIAG